MEPATQDITINYSIKKSKTFKREHSGSLNKDHRGSLHRGHHRSGHIKVNEEDGTIDIESLVDHDALAKLKQEQAPPRSTMLSAWGGSGSDERGRGNDEDGGRTFFTDIDAEEKEHGGQLVPARTELVEDKQASQMLEMANTVRVALQCLPPSLDEETVSMPVKVNIRKIMLVATSSLALPPPQAALWRHYFYTPQSQEIIQDGFWYVVCHWFGRPEAQLSQQKTLKSSSSSSQLESRPKTVQGGPRRPVRSKRPSSRVQSAKGKRSRNNSIDESRFNPIKQEVLARISRNFVRMLLAIRGPQKDAFLSVYYDGLAQTIFYSLSVAYPESQVAIDNSTFKGWLVQLCASWTLGHIPASLSVTHWKVLKREPKKNTLLQRALKHDTCPPRHQLEKKLEYNLVQSRRAAQRRQRQEQKRRQFYHQSPLPSSNGKGTKASRNRRLTGPQNNLARSPGGGPKTPSVTPKSYGGNSPNANFDTFQYPPSALISRPTTPTVQAAHTDAPSKVVESARSSQKKLKGPTREPSVFESHMDHEKIPVRVVRKMTRVHHSDLVKHYLERGGCSAASNHVALAIPMTKSEKVASPIEEFLDALKLANQKCQIGNLSLQKDYGELKERSEKQMEREAKNLNKKKEKHERELALAMREASAFSKNLVSDYQDKKYGELKNPSKSLALRRLGHFRASKEEQMAGSLVAREAESAILLSVANRPRIK